VKWTPKYKLITFHIHIFFLSVCIKESHEQCFGNEMPKLRYFFPQNDPYNVTVMVKDDVENRFVEKLWTSKTGEAYLIFKSQKFVRRRKKQVFWDFASKINILHTKWKQINYNKIIISSPFFQDHRWNISYPCWRKAELSCSKSQTSTGRN